MPGRETRTDVVKLTDDEATWLREYFLAYDNSLRRLYEIAEDVSKNTAHDEFVEFLVKLGLNDALDIEDYSIRDDC